MKAKRYIKRPVLAAVLALAVSAGWAVPAKPGMHQYHLPDGSTVDVSVVGDEHCHFYLTSDGYVLLSDADGILRYATVGNDGNIEMTRLEASDPSRRTPAEESALRTLDRDAVRAAAFTKQASAGRKAMKRIPSEIVTDYPTTGKPKGLVLLVEFQDVKFRTPDVRQAFEDLLNKPGYSHNGATGSASDYFRDNSNGSFTPDFELFGPVTLPETEPYYGGESASLYDVQGWLMARDGAVALREAYPDLDFSEFDNDGDGFVDNIFIFYAGYGQNEGAPGWTIWPHSAELWDMYNIDLTFDGVKINKYACTNELKGTSGDRLTGIGTFVHEYSHILGLMDIYPTQSSSRDVSPGSWDVMDLGSYNNDGNTPPHFNAFERYSLGWLNPRKLTGPENVILEPLHESNGAVMIATELDNEFFLLENRQQSGWDAHVKGHGMLVWHIDYDRGIWEKNRVNNEFSHQRVDIVEADNTIGESTRAGDPFPGAGNARAFTSTSVPPMSTWIGVDPDMPITDISEIDGKITFRVKGGGDALQVPEALPATDVTPTSFTANWEIAAGLDTYELDVRKGDSQVPFLSKRVTGVTSCPVTGLEPDTDYAYTVRSCDGERTSYDSENVKVRTLSPTLDMLAPVALDGENVGDDSFIARWEEMEDADGYLIDVYVKKIIDPKVDIVDFSDGIDLPDGWQTNCSSTGSLSGYVGASAPSLRMMSDGDRIASPEYPGGINTMSFWYRANSVDEESALDVEALIGGAWSSLLTIKPLSRTEGRTIVFGGADADAALPASAQRLRIVFRRVGGGSVYLDDIKVEHDGSFEPIYVEGFEEKDCASDLKVKVAGLKPLTQYYYTVKAYDNSGLKSLPSREIAVYTGMGSVADNPADTVSVTVQEGFMTVAGADGLYLTLMSLDGISLYEGKASAGQPVCIRAPRGIYVLSVGGKAYKVIV